MSKRERFLDKVVDMTDNHLYKRRDGRKKLGDTVEIDWDYDTMSITLRHDNYGFIRTFYVSDLYHEFKSMDKEERGKMKKFIRKSGIAREIAKYAYNFVGDRKETSTSSLDECSCDDCHGYEDDYDCEDNFECDCCEEECECTCDNEVEVEVQEEDKKKEEEVISTPTIPARTRTPNPPCPHCQTGVVNKDGKKNGIQRYYCKTCGKYFSENTL
jgi:hypothetical protein